MQGRSTTAARKIRAIADRAHGVVTRAELLGAGLTKAEIEHRLRVGLLLHEMPGHGVYRVGHRAPNTESRFMAAVKACGPGAVLSGMAAAWLLGVLRGRPPEPEVTAETKRRVRGVVTRRAKPLTRLERSMWRGIPTTSVARTLVDIAPRLAPDELARACHEAAVNHYLKPRQVEAVLRLRPNSPGAAKLRSVLLGEHPIALSRLEARFHKLLDGAGLARPDTNVRVGSHRLDCHWRNPPLTVELDSYRYHNSRYSWEQDRKREREAHAREEPFRRYTWSDVFEDPRPMLAELRRLVPTAAPKQSRGRRAA